MARFGSLVCFVVGVLVASSCAGRALSSFDNGVAPADAGTFPSDGGRVDDADAGADDGGFVDAGVFDSDAGPLLDGGSEDAGEISLDAGFVDAGFVDAGFVDAGDVDAGVVDAGVDAGQESDAGAPAGWMQTFDEGVTLSGPFALPGDDLVLLENTSSLSSTGATVPGTSCAIERVTSEGEIVWTLSANATDEIVCSLGVSASSILLGVETLEDSPSVTVESATLDLLPREAAFFDVSLDGHVIDSAFGGDSQRGLPVGGYPAGGFVSATGPGSGAGTGILLRQHDDGGAVTLETRYTSLPGFVTGVQVIDDDLAFVLAALSLSQSTSLPKTGGGQVLLAGGSPSSISAAIAFDRQNGALFAIEIMSQAGAPLMRAFASDGAQLALCGTSPPGSVFSSATGTTLSFGQAASRDMKPLLVVIDRSGDVVFIDFGSPGFDFAACGFDENGAPYDAKSVLPASITIGDASTGAESIELFVALGGFPKALFLRDDDVYITGKQASGADAFPAIGTHQLVPGLAGDVRAFFLKTTRTQIGL